MNSINIKHTLLRKFQLDINVRSYKKNKKIACTNTIRRGTNSNSNTKTIYLWSMNQSRPPLQCLKEPITRHEEFPCKHNLMNNLLKDGRDIRTATSCDHIHEALFGIFASMNPAK